MLCGLDFVVSLADCTYLVLHDLSVVVWDSIAGCESVNVRIASFGKHPPRRVIISYFPFFGCLQLVIPIHLSILRREDRTSPCTPSSPNTGSYHLLKTRQVEMNKQDVVIPGLCLQYEDLAGI